MKTHLAIDFGGTRSRAALFDDELRMICRAETLSRVEEGMDAGLRRLSQIGSIIDRVRVQQSLRSGSPRLRPWTRHGAL